MPSAPEFPPFDVPTDEVEARLLERIYAALDDDRPRLAWAEFLEARGGRSQLARAKLIRVQCAKRPDAPGVKTILRAHRSAWTERYSFAATSVRQWHFERGFPARLTLSAETFASIGTALLDAVPTVRALRFHEASNELADLEACEALPRVLDADLSAMCNCGECPIEPEVGRFVKSPRLGALRRLSLAKDRLTPAQMKALAQARALTALEVLDLSENPLGSRGVLELSKATLPRLTELNLSRTGVDAEGLSALLESPLARTLRRLSVVDTPVAEQAAKLVLKAARRLELVAQSPGSPRAGGRTARPVARATRRE